MARSSDRGKPGSVCRADIPELSAVTFPERSERSVGHMKAGSSGELAPQALGGRRRLRASYAAIGLAALVLLLAIAAVPLTLAARQGVLYNVGQVATFLPIAAVGFMVAWHRPHNPIGWLLIVTAAGALLTVDGQLYAWLIYRLGHHLPFGPAALLLAFAWLTNFVALPLAILLFPDGVLPACWRWVLWAYVAVTGFLLVSEYIAVVGLMAANDVRIDASGGLAALDDRSGGTAWLSPVRAVIFPIMVVFWLSFIARLLLSWRRASIERRQQLKWLLTGCAITLASGVLSIASVPAAFQSAVNFISDLGFVALPVCVGIAILKYRLYDIDRIISRALAYAIVTGVLIGLYTGLVLLATRGLSFRTPVAVAASTLAAAALFNPLRQRVQRIVDRRFNRARYDADQIVAAFAARLKDTVDLRSVRDDLATVVDQALQPAHVFVWVNERG
jgi:hypothetical protein